MSSVKFPMTSRRNPPKPIAARSGAIVDCQIGTASAERRRYRRVPIDAST